MTAPTDPAARLRLGLVAISGQVAPLGEPFGWTCHRCGGRFTIPYPPTPDMQDRVVGLLLDAVRSHAAAGCAA